MANNLRIFLIILILVSMYVIFRTIKKKKFSMKYGMYWNIVLLLLLILIIFPDIIEALANFLGFKEAPNMLYLIAIFILFYKVFTIYGIMCKLTDNNKEVIQELAILKYELEKKENK